MNRARPEPLLKPKLLAISVAACFALNAGTVQANPTGPSVVSGGVGFSGLGTGALTITNQAGANAIINWNGFSIGVNELTRFQQFANLAVLNRVTGSQLSSILGSLQSDGRVFLINPNGIVFGGGARIDTAGLVASSLALSDQDFLANRLRFTEVPGAGAVVNNGVIETATGGRVYLVAPSVENNGLIQSPQGAIVLAAGKEVELVDAASPFVTVKVAAAEQAVNVGDLVAAGGQIGMFGALVSNSGVVAAGGAVAGPGGEIRLVATNDLTLGAGSVVSANGTSGGNVLLQAEGGTNLVGGTVEARGNSGRGGEVSALGVRVGVVGHGVIDASGDNGGGTVLVGGDYQGGNAGVQNAERTYIGSDGVIRADAMRTGDGGRVVVWADGDTRFFGSISAKGGTQSGNGGFVETSGKQTLQAFGSVNVAAPAGQGGMWLLDPTDININPGLGGDMGLIEMDGLLAFADNTGEPTIVGLGAIEAAFAYGNASVRLQATNDITVNGNLTITPSGDLILEAGNDIRFNAFGLVMNGNLSLQAASSGGTPVTGAISTVPGGGNITTNGGNLFADGYSVQLGNINTVGGAYGGGNVSVSAQMSNISTGSITTGGGSVDLDAWSGGVTVGAMSTSNMLGDSGFGTSNGYVDIYSYGSATTGSIMTAGLHPRHGAGGSVFVHSETGVVTVNGNINASGANGVDGGYYGSNFGGTRGGDVILSRGGAAFAGTAIQVNGSIIASGGNGVTASDAGFANHGGGDGGSVTIGDYCDGFCGPVSGNVVVTGTINVSGGHGGSTDSVSSSTEGGHAGPITIAVDGSFSGGALVARGGNAGFGSDGDLSSNFGGWGGSVDITAGGQVSVGSIDTSAGAGASASGSVSSTNSFGGDGGSAGYVYVDAGSISIGGISAVGGNGGAGGSASGYSSSYGGDGGEGGPILLFASAGPTAISGTINASGGNGGTAGTAADYAKGGLGGSAASIGCCKESGLIGEVALVKEVFVSPPRRFVFDGIAIEGTSVTTGPIIGRGGAGGAGGSVSTGAGYASGGGGGSGAAVWLGTTSDGSTYATGPVTSGLIDVSGGAGGNSGPVGTSWTWGGLGGWGGQVDIYGSTVNILGPIFAPGGQGGNAINGSILSTSFPSTTPDGGNGGSGGGVSIYATGETRINVGATLGATAINVAGGAGGAGAPANSPAGNGGSGGSGGSVNIASTPNMTLFGSVLAAGGAGGVGGAGNVSNAGGFGGAGGGGGQVFLDASSATGTATGNGIIFVLAGTQFNVQGGLGGFGGANGGTAGSSGLSSTFLKGSDYFGTIVVLDPLSIPAVNQAAQQTAVEGAIAFVGGEKKEEEEDKSQKELGSCKG